MYLHSPQSVKYAGEIILIRLTISMTEDFVYIYTYSIRSCFILRTTYLQSSVTPTLAGPSGRRPPGMWRSPSRPSAVQWWQPPKASLGHPGDVHFGLLKPISFIPWFRNDQNWPKGPYPNQTKHIVQSLLKVAIHGGGGATRPDLGRAVQFEGHWIARPNPGRQRTGGAAGAGAEWGSNRSAESGNRGAGKLW